MPAIVGARSGRRKEWRGSQGEMSMHGLSVYEEAEKAVREHKWLASERAGHDLGHDAVREWTKSYWLQFYRWRFVQHLRGEVFWKEFDAAAYGIADGRLVAHRELLDEIM